MGFHAVGQCARAGLLLSSNPEVRVPRGIQEASRRGVFSASLLQHPGVHPSFPILDVKPGPLRSLARAVESRARAAGRGSHCSNSLEKGAGRLPEKNRGWEHGRGGRGPAHLGSRWVTAKRGGERRGRSLHRAGSSGARGECDISGAGRLRLEEAARLGCAGQTSARGGRSQTRAGGRDVGEGEAKGQGDQGQRDPPALLLFRGGELAQRLGVMQILPGGSGTSSGPGRGWRRRDRARVRAAAPKCLTLPLPPRFLGSSPEYTSRGDYHWRCHCEVACRREIPV